MLHTERLHDSAQPRQERRDEHGRIFSLSDLNIALQCAEL